MRKTLNILKMLQFVAFLAVFCISASLVSCDDSDSELTTIVENVFHEMLKFPSKVNPDLIRIFRHQNAIPQYEITTGERLATVEKMEQKFPGLHIAGNLRDGIGMAHRIKQARDLALKLT